MPLLIKHVVDGLTLVAAQHGDVMLPVKAGITQHGIRSSWLETTLTSVGGPVEQTLFILLGLAVVMSLTRIGSRMMLLGIGRKIEHDLRNKLFTHLLTLPPSFYSHMPVGELMSRLTNDVQSLRFMLGGGLMLAINTSIIYCFTLPLMFWLSPKLSLTVLMVLPLAVIVMGKLSITVKTRYYHVQQALADVSTIAQENLSGMSVIQAYGKETEESARFAKSSEGYLNRFIDFVRVRVWMFLVMAMVTSLGTLIVLGFGGREVILGTMTLGTFITFTLYLERLSWPTASLGWTISTIQQSGAAIQRIDEVLTSNNELENTHRSDTVTDWPGSEIRFENLSFSYPKKTFQRSETDEKSDEAVTITTSPKPVINNVSLTIPAGKTVAVVGKVGSGKTTLLSFLPKLFAVDEGMLFIGDVDINRIPLSLLREHMVMMPQHSFLFSTMVNRNIAFAQPDLDQVGIEDAATIAQVHQDILKLRNQYETLVGERGITLSGGQRQRVSLARALVDAPDILILDDPFSNVDAETEQAIIQALSERKIFAGKTTLLATHRLSVVQQCDMVILLEDGQLIATGHHDELIKTEPKYQELNRLEAARSALDEVWGLESEGNDSSNQPNTERSLS